MRAVLVLLCGAAAQQCKSTVVRYIGVNHPDPCSENKDKTACVAPQCAWVESQVMQLMNAARERDVDNARKLIQSGVNVDAQDEFGRSALMYALVNGDERSDLMDLLMKNDADVNLLDSSGASPLKYAAMGGKLSSADLLLKKGASLDTKDNFGRTPVHFAARYNQTSLLDLYLKSNVVAVNKRDAMGRTPLYYAATWGLAGNVKKLAGEYGADVNLYQANGETPLDAARLYGAYWCEDSYQHGHCRGMESPKEWLIPRTADPLKPRGRNADNKLLVAASDGDFATMVAEIAAGSDINVQDDDMKTPLMYAVQQKGLRVAEELLTNDADMNKQDVMGRTALMYAVRTVGEKTRPTSKDEINVLMRGAKCCDLGNNKKNIGLRWHNRGRGNHNMMVEAAAKGDVALVGNILDLGMPVDETDEAGNTALVAAARRNKDLVAKMLISRGANLEMGEDGWTPLMVTVRYGLSDMSKMLLNEGADPNAMTSEGRTPLHYAAEGAWTGVLRLLVNARAAHVGDQVSGMTPILLAAMSTGTRDSPGHQVIQMLIDELGVDVDTMSEGQATVLMICAQTGKVRTVKMLLARGADVNRQDDRGMTALMYAASGGHYSVTQDLVASDADATLTNYDGKTAAKIAEEGGYGLIAGFLSSTAYGQSQGVGIAAIVLTIIVSCGLLGSVYIVRSSQGKTAMGEKWIRLQEKKVEEDANNAVVDEEFDIPSTSA